MPHRRASPLLRISWTERFSARSLAIKLLFVGIVFLCFKRIGFFTLVFSKLLFRRLNLFAVRGREGGCLCVPHKRPPCIIGYLSPAHPARDSRLAARKTRFSLAPLRGRRHPGGFMPPDTPCLPHGAWAEKPALKGDCNSPRIENLVLLREQKIQKRCKEDILIKELNSSTHLRV